MTEALWHSPALREFCGCRLQPHSLDVYLLALEQQLSGGGPPALWGHHNLHSLYLMQRTPAVAAFYRACDHCYVDGVGVLWLLRAAGVPARRAQRFSLMDCLPAVLEWAQQAQLRLFYLGSSPLAVERARSWITAQWPRLKLQLHHGYLPDQAAEQAAVETINAHAPDLLLVGMGMPRQEAFILRHRAQLRASVILQAGGTLDYYTSLQARPPQAWSRRGLAWLYRLLHDPRRLWRRYLVTPWSLLGPTLRLRRALRASRQAQHRGHGH